MSTSRNNSVRVWDLHHAEFREDYVYREGTLRFLFNNPIGRFLMRYVLSNRISNKLITLRQTMGFSRREIIPFIKFFNIDTTEFIRPVEDFRSFAEFFVRELRPESRPANDDHNSIISPCDGRIEWLITNLAPDTAFEVKGARFTLSQVFSSQDLACSFTSGSILGIYLAPFDCHWFCYPHAGRIVSRRKLGNNYFSVNRESIAAGFRVFDRNIRTYSILEHNSLRWAMVEVAGFYAGRIVEVNGSGTQRSKGEIKGYFELGGSFVLLVFPQGMFRVDAVVQDHLSDGIPVRVKRGERIGIFKEVEVNDM